MAKIEAGMALPMADPALQRKTWMLGNSQTCTVLPGYPFTIFGTVRIHGEKQGNDDAKSEDTNRMHGHGEAELSGVQEIGCHDGCRASDIAQNHQPFLFKEAQKAWA